MTRDERLPEPAMLSHYERRNLDRIEQWFHADDPDLAEALSKGRPPRSEALARAGRLAVDIVALLLVVLGALSVNSGLVFFGAVTGAVAAVLHARAHRERGSRNHRSG